MTPPDEIRHIPTRLIGRTIHVYREVTSTNDIVAEAARTINGLGVLADHQTQGRGQHGRIWSNHQPNDSILLSIGIHPPPAILRPVILTAWAAVAISDAIYELIGLQCKIKWPNDLLIHGKKVCGILIEQSNAVVLGLGLNLNQTRDQFDELDLSRATSLGIESGQVIDRPEALDSILMHLDDEYDRLLNGELVPLESDWKWRIGLLGRQVHVEKRDGTSSFGRLTELSFDGLQLVCENQREETILPELVHHIVPLSATLTME